MQLPCILSRHYDLVVQNHDRIIVALDRTSRGDLLALADKLHGVVGVYKLGLQAFVANGPSIVRDLVSQGGKVFLDLKLHDIPNTVQHAVEEASALGAAMMTIHASGGRAMMSAAAKAAEGHGKTRPLILGVTILTSLGASDLGEIGFAGLPADSAVRLAKLAQDSGLDGVVASPLEITSIRAACGPGFVIVTPGIRSAHDSKGDQKRTMTAKEAIAAGATYIVVGRPITEARDPRAAAVSLLA